MAVLLTPVHPVLQKWVPSPSWWHDVIYRQSSKKSYWIIFPSISFVGKTTSPFSQSIISHDNLIVDCNSPQAKVKDYCISSCFSSNEHILLQDIFSDHSMMDINIKHFLFRDGTQVWIAPSFHYAGKLEL